ncbi:nitrite reductase (NAD(P)H) small subunit [Streptomyces armeniacus]|uniref:Nitrite reductase (NAD(P)H) small subunit n=1 Tax=Streptomyces armeniacus TaxID=83291 RepID=A0A345XT15_9ACTN|nr:nitrite reductase small subunit NirD [Streptomyces armeniacus]AXK34781.1 nitrite reductase (NAD(P)H) small subunit [Streptomyces armeniacus]
MTPTTTAAAPAPAVAPAPAAPAAPAAPPVVRLRVRAGGHWHAVCDDAELTAGRGVAALLPGGSQVALFKDRAGRTYAIGNRDPFTGAYVLSRGLLGSADGRPFVASPLLKQRFDLATGRCLDDDSVSVPSYPVEADPPAA